MSTSSRKQNKWCAYCLNFFYCDHLYVSTFSSFRLNLFSIYTQSFVDTVELTKCHHLRPVLVQSLLLFSIKMSFQSLQIRQWAGGAPNVKNQKYFGFSDVLFVSSECAECEACLSHCASQEESSVVGI